MRVICIQSFGLKLADQWLLFFDRTQKNLGSDCSRQRKRFLIIIGPASHGCIPLAHRPYPASGWQQGSPYEKAQPQQPGGHYSAVCSHACTVVFTRGSSQRFCLASFTKRLRVAEPKLGLGSVQNLLAYLESNLAEPASCFMRNFCRE
jgi:hypothetical protein